MNKIYYISDLHFCHANMLKYDNRPWLTVEEGDKGLIEKYNSVVDDGDLVYNLGDFVWGGISRWENIIPQLNGKMYIVKGNHDDYKILKKVCEEFPDKIIGWSEQKTVNDNGRFVVLNHCPMLFYPNMHQDNWYHLYGHVHTSYDYNIILHTQKVVEELYIKPIKMWNVGAGCLNYTPMTLDQIIEHYKTADVKISQDPANHC